MRHRHTSTTSRLRCWLFVACAALLGVSCHRATHRSTWKEEQCLAGPIDYAARPSDTVPVVYTNDLRLGRARGQAILLSRPLCDMYGHALCRFVEAHERAHHHGRTVGVHSPCAEAVADCWAARHSDAAANAAALAFLRGRRSSGDYHGEPSRRARIIAACAAPSLSSNATGAPPRTSAPRSPAAHPEIEASRSNYTAAGGEGSPARDGS